MAIIPKFHPVLSSLPDGTTVVSRVSRQHYEVRKGGLINLKRISGGINYEFFGTLHNEWDVVQTPEEEELWV